ncbi:MAG: FAD-dependent oxidoreductase, partial [Immundisolibacteraceae bacterium]|nr:FAD-dependent oxidoreductase [Immundisolibacteraceae bacterium]
MATMLPEGVSSSDFDQAIREIVKIIGDEWVFRDSELAPYLDHMSAVPAEYRMPSAALAPADIEQTQAILKIANRFSLPLWTYGNGKNWAYGGPTPLHAGYLVLDLKRMNRILEVNEDS